MSTVITSDELQSRWDDSYRRHENFLFYPHEEVIRFFARRIRRRIAPGRFHDIHPKAATGRLLDLGCGIGRHVLFGLTMGVDAYGVDLSEVAIASARDWLRRDGHADAERRCVVGDVAALPWPDGTFTFAVSHGVLDSMPFAVAQAGVRELHRVIEPGGLLYCDLISGDESGRPADFAGEALVEKDHEKGTVQSYFNRDKIDELIGEHFKLLECAIIRRTDILTGRHASRWHLVAERASQ
jgi:SAM-dependent methyltransferase